jgi:hypothetical protein
MSKNSSYVGPTCQTPTCYHIPSDHGAVCSGLGKCVSPDKCVCDPPSTGNQCEFKTYTWTGIKDTIWSNPSNWLVLRNGVQLVSFTFPSLSDDVVVISGKPRC